MIAFSKFHEIFCKHHRQIDSEIHKHEQEHYCLYWWEIITSSCGFTFTLKTILKQKSTVVVLVKLICFTNTTTVIYLSKECSLQTERISARVNYSSTAPQLFSPLWSTPLSLWGHDSPLSDTLNVWGGFSLLASTDQYLECSGCVTSPCLGSWTELWRMSAMDQSRRMWSGWRCAVASANWQKYRDLAKPKKRMSRKNKLMANKTREEESEWIRVFFIFSHLDFWLVSWR